jgi:hypothetical protein
MTAQQLRDIVKRLRAQIEDQYECKVLSDIRDGATIIRNAYNGITQYQRGSVPGNAGIVLNEQASCKRKGRIYKDYKFYHRILPVRSGVPFHIPL